MPAPHIGTLVNVLAFLPSECFGRVMNFNFLGGVLAITRVLGIMRRKLPGDSTMGIFNKYRYPGKEFESLKRAFSRKTFYFVNCYYNTTSKCGF